MEDIKWIHTEKALIDYAGYWVEVASKIIEDNGNVASGNLIQTMKDSKPVVSFADDTLSVKIELAGYWQYIEEGLKGNGGSKTDKPMRNTTSPYKAPEWRKAYPHILNWIQVKPSFSLPEGFTEKSFAAAAAHNIDALGTEPHPFLQEAIEKAWEKFEVIVADAIQEDIADYINEKVLNQLANIL